MCFWRIPVNTNPILTECPPRSGIRYVSDFFNTGPVLRYKSVTRWLQCACYADLRTCIAIHFIMYPFQTSVASLISNVFPPESVFRRVFQLPTSRCQRQSPPYSAATHPKLSKIKRNHRFDSVTSYRRCCCRISHSCTTHIQNHSQQVCIQRAQMNLHELQWRTIDATRRTWIYLTCQDVNWPFWLCMGNPLSQPNPPQP